MTLTLRRLPLPDRIAALYVLAYLAWFAVRTPGTPATELAGMAAFLPLGLVVAWANWRNSRVAALDGRTRGAWTLLAISAVLLWFSGSAWSVYLELSGRTDYPFWVDWLELVQSLFALAGCLLFPGRRLWARSRTRYLLDICLTVTASFVLAFQYGLRTVLRGAPLDGNSALLSVIDWATFAVISVGFLQKRDRTARTAMGLLLAASASYFFANYVWAGMPAYRTGDPVDLLWFGAWVFRWVAARVASYRYDRPAEYPEARPDEEREDYRGAAFAYFMVAGAFLLLIGQILWGDQRYLGVLATAAVIMAATLVVRQLAELAENRRLLAAHLAQEERFRSLVQRSSDGVLIVNRDGLLSYVSPSVERLFGKDSDARVGARLLDLVSVDDRAVIVAAFRQQGGRPRVIQTRVQAGDGAWHEIEAAWSDLRDDPVVGGIVLNCRDVTERNELERQLRHAQKLDAVGHMAGGLAHDFNNVLTAIRGYSELLRVDLDEPERATEDLQQIEGAVDRAAAITSKLLAFSRKQPVQRTVVDVNAIVRDLLPLLGQLLTPRVELVAETQPGIWPVKADAGQLEQVLVNLATNARDAMPEGGCLHVSTENRTWAGGATALGKLAAGQYVALVVSDEGQGITEEVRARIFEPFFSTKPRGRGMGLGLAMVAGIVSDSGGGILLDSAPGRGTSVTVLLPRSADGSPAVSAEPPSLPPAVAATILLVDDEPGVRTVIRRMLEHHGYVVIEAGAGEEALAVAAEPGRRIDLLLTDLVMPGMHGSALAAAFCASRPGVPVICVTGFAGEADQLDLGDHVSAIVYKPFASEALLRAVAAALAPGGHTAPAGG